MVSQTYVRAAGFAGGVEKIRHVQDAQNVCSVVRNARNYDIMTMGPFMVSGEYITYYTKGEKIMKSYFIIDYDGDQVTYDRSNTELWAFFREVAIHFAMRDCSDEEISKVVYNGNEYRYSGWAPGMEFTFYNVADPEDTYTLWLPEYDH